MLTAISSVIPMIPLVAGIRNDDVVLRVAPVFHVMGASLSLMDAILTGTRLVLASTPFDVNKGLQAIQSERITNLIAVPAVNTFFVSSHICRCYKGFLHFQLLNQLP